MNLPRHLPFPQLIAVEARCYRCLVRRQPAELAGGEQGPPRRRVVYRLHVERTIPARLAGAHPHIAVAAGLDCRAVDGKACKLLRAERIWQRVRIRRVERSPRRKTLPLQLAVAAHGAPVAQAQRAWHRTAWTGYGFDIHGRTPG